MARARITAAPDQHLRGSTSVPTVAELCETHAHLPRAIARWTAIRLPAHVDAADLEPAAWEGLHTAAVTHDPALGRFESWARFKIRAAVLDELRGLDPQSKPWRAREHALDRARDALTARLSRAPTPLELVTAADITLEDYGRHQRARVTVTSLDHEATAHERTMRDPALTADEAAGSDRDLAGWVRAAVIALPDRQRGIIRGLYWGGQTTTAIAGVLGVHPSRVSQIHTVAVGMIRDALAWHLDSDPGPALPPCRAERRDGYRDAVKLAYTQLSSS